MEIITTHPEDYLRSIMRRLMSESEINFDAVKETVKAYELFYQYNPGLITQLVAKAFNTTVENIKSSRQLRYTMAEPRAVCMYYLKVVKNASNNYIGPYYGRNYSTVSHSKTLVPELLATDKKFKAKYEKFLELVDVYEEYL
jgi:chromosomal replication initiation ATPase DnaA